MVNKGKSPVPASATSEPTLTVTAQQSRFHAEAAANDSTTQEIVVKDLSISVGNQEILSHAKLQLQPGRHYVLIGRNGIGKSTLLRAIATGQIPGIPQAVRILLLGQTQSNFEEDPDAVDSNVVTVFDHVIRSDRKRERLLYEARRLSEAIENTSDPNAAVRVYRKLVYERLERDVEDAKLIAAKRSGVRGAKARKVLVDMEEELLQAQERLGSLGVSHKLDTAEPAIVGEETRAACEMLSDIQSSLELMDASAADAKARSVLMGLGFSAESLDKPMSQLSGGWKTRCSLARALCQSADLLLLDEPTNYLDLPSIIWLEKYVQTLDPGTIVIIVTHDRAFADGVADELLVLRNLTLEHFRGNVSGYEFDRLKTYKYLSRMKAAQEKQKKHMQATIDHNVKSAKRAGDDKKLKQAASRKKKLDERMGMEVSAKGTRFKLNRDLAGWHNSRRDEIEVPAFDPPVRMSFPTSPSDLRFPGALVSLEKVTFGYSQGKRSPILGGINLNIHLGDRVGVAGLNGSGKSTLVSLAMASEEGAAESLSPDEGTISRHTRARFGLYSQQAVEELNVIAAADPKLTALSHLLESACAELSEKEARGLLSSLGLAGKVASDVPIALLSGGQKVRLALAKLLWKPPHLLILDEVTTHLDSDSIQALALSLRRYEGAILVITHDRYFMRCVVEGESPMSMARQDGEEEEDEESDSDDGKGQVKKGFVYRLSKGKLTKLEVGMQQYEEIAAKASAKLGKA